MDSKNTKNLNKNNLVFLSPEPNTLVSDDSENGDSFDNGLSFSTNNLDSTVSSSTNSSIPVIKFNNGKSSHSPTQLVEISFKDLSSNSLNVTFEKFYLFILFQS